MSRAPWNNAKSIRLARISSVLKRIDVRLVPQNALSPVPPSSCPFLRDIDHCKVEHLEQSIVSREDRLGLCDFPELSVEVLNGIRGIITTS